MKKILYAAGTKLIAVLLIAACAVLSVNVVLDEITAYDRAESQIYGFENDVSESRHLSALLREPESIVYNGYLQWYENKITTENENNPVMADRSFSVVFTQNKTAADYVFEGLAYLEDSPQINYFVQINDIVFSNCGAAKKEDLLDAEFYMLSERDAAGDTNYVSSVKNPYGLGLDDGELFGQDTITICTSIKDAYAIECVQSWNEQAVRIRSMFASVLGFVVVALLLLAYLIAVTGKTAGGEYRGMWLDAVWTEIHLALIAVPGVCVVAFNLILIDELWSGYLPLYLVKSVVLLLTAVGVLLVLNSLLAIIRQIKTGKFIKASILCRIAKWAFRTCLRICRFAGRKIKGFFRIISGMLSRRTGVILISMLLVYTALIGLCGIFVPETAIALFAAAALFGFTCFILAYRAKDVDAIKRGAAEVRKGNLRYKIAEPKCEDLKVLASNINEIAMGLDESVSAKLKAERLKTDLITNVSHDLKTPLTSIISYTELLAKVEGLPEEAKDYIGIIAKKSDRLKNLTQDLFDISKVQSGNAPIVLEKLDVALLLNQSLGEHDSEIKKSELKFCVDVQKELYIAADGRKMSRVISNLISNILKYTMKNTRVFITAFAKDDVVIIELKNIASYPMEFDAEEITGRFVRGDESRTAEGNGLGLAIARSYTEACGGKFNVILDGDLFKAVLEFSKYN